MVLKEGDVLAFKWNTIYGKLIYLSNYINYGKKGYSHIAIIGEVKKHSVIVYEALKDGFVEIEYGVGELDNYCYKGLLDIYRAKYKLNNIKKNCKKYLGRGYGFLDIFSIGFYTLFRKYALRWNANAKHLICSEAVALILYDCNDKINLSRELGKKWSYITPTDITDSKYVNKIKK